MPSILPHLLIPVLLAFAFLPVARKRILWWSPIALAPDLDYFFAKEYHRAALSNIWIPLILIATVVILHRLRDREADFWEYAWRPGASGNISLVVYFVLGHLLMDVFAGGIVLLWPLTETNYYLFFQIVVDTATNRPVITGEAGTEPGIPTLTANYRWWSTIDTAMATLTAFVVAAWGVVRLARPKPVIVRRLAVVDPSHKE